MYYILYTIYYTIRDTRHYTLPNYPVLYHAILYYAVLYHTIIRYHTINTLKPIKGILAAPTAAAHLRLAVGGPERRGEVAASLAMGDVRADGKVCLGACGIV